MLEPVKWATALLGLISAFLAIMAARVHVRDSIDDFISDIHRQSWWSLRAAIATSVTALLLVFQTLLERAH